MLKISDKLYLYIWLSALSLFLFFLSTTISNAETSIFYSIAIFMTIFIYYHEEYKISIPDKRFLFPYLIFLVCCLFQQLLFLIKTPYIIYGNILHGHFRFFYLLC